MSWEQQEYFYLWYKYCYAQQRLYNYQASQFFPSCFLPSGVSLQHSPPIFRAASFFVHRIIINSRLRRTPWLPRSSQQQHRAWWSLCLSANQSIKGSFFPTIPSRRSRTTQATRSSSHGITTCHGDIPRRILFRRPLLRWRRWLRPRRQRQRRVRTWMMSWWAPWIRRRLEPLPRILRWNAPLRVGEWPTYFVQYLKNKTKSFPSWCVEDFLLPTCWSHISMSFFSLLFFDTAELLICWRSVTCLDFYCGVAFCTIQKSEWAGWRHCRTSSHVTGKIRQWKSSHMTVNMGSYCIVLYSTRLTNLFYFIY